MNYRSSNQVHSRYYGFTLLARTVTLCPEGIPKVSQGYPQYRELPLNRKVETLHFTCARTIDFPHRVLKCDFIKIKLVKYCDFSGHSKRTKGILAKNQHFGANCLWDISPVMLKWLHGIQILLNLTWFITLRTESNLERFVWSHHIKKVVVSRRQFHFHNKGFALSLVVKGRVLKLGNDLFNSWKTTFHDKLKELKKVTSL